MTRVLRAATAIAAVLLLGLGSAGCVATGPVEVTADRSLFPAFSRGITDYVNRCDPATPTRVTVDAVGGATASVDGSPARGGRFTVSVPQQVGRRFTIAFTADGRTTTHSVRCLPRDFPRFEVTNTADPQLARAHRPDYYATMPWVYPNPGSYPIIFDHLGVPVWWGPKTDGLYATVLPGGHPTWVKGGVFEEHRLDGSLVRTYSATGHLTDEHDLVLLPNGNHVVVTLTPKPGTDLRPWGGPASATVLNHLIQEVTPAGAVVWSWDTAAHIPIEETGPYWQAQDLIDPGGPLSSLHDPYHYNSIQPTDDGYLVSFRHLDALVEINRASGAIEWKLGGSLRPESLGVVGDPLGPDGGPFRGQHDAQLQADGTLTLFDNGTGAGRAPRAVTYRLDLARRRVVLLNQVTDPSVTASGCCGSARVPPGGNHVIGWGGNATAAPDITETTASGERIFSLRFPDHSVYRATPIPYKSLSREALREGMDAQYAT